MAQAPDSTPQRDDDPFTPEASFAFESAPPSRGSERLDALNRAIDAAPDAAANYVLRAELFLQRGQVVLARADYTKALTLAEAQLDYARWGHVLQSIADRAREALRTLPQANHSED